MKCIDCVFLSECKKFRTDFNDQNTSCKFFILNCEYSKSCTQKKCRNNSDKPIFTIENNTETTACGADPYIMVANAQGKKEKKLNEAYRKGLRCGAKVKDTLGSVVDHWFFDSDNNLLCSLKSSAGSGNLSFRQLKLTGENAYRRLDGAEINPKLPEWLSPQGWLKKEPETKNIKRKERTWYITIYFEYPYYSAYVVSESEGICFSFKSIQSLEEHLQKVLIDNEIDPKKTYGYGFRFEPDMFDCKIIQTL